MKMNGKHYRTVSLLIILIALILTAFVVPAPYNRAVDWIKEKTNIGLPQASEKSFKLGLDLKGGTQILYQADLSETTESEKSDRMDSLRNLIEQRVNQFGVAEPLVQVQGDRLIVELAGVVDPIEAMEMIGETPFLEFKELKSDSEFEKEIDEIDEKAYLKAKEILEMIEGGADFAETAKGYSDDTFSAIDGGYLGRFGRGAMVEEFEDAVFGLSQGELSGIVETDFGYHIILKNSDEDENQEIEASHILISRELPIFSQWKSTELGGSHLKTARHTFNQNTGAMIIELQFTPEGADIFEQVTQRNINKPLAIFLDGKSIIDTDGDGIITEYDLYAPIIKEKISGGKAVITGDLDQSSVRSIVSRLRSGALPVPIEVVSHQNVGAALGTDSLNQSLIAGMVGFLIIALFMTIVYRLPGFLASLSLTFYAIMVLFIFKLIPVVLTLSGIAGFILSIGMAIDANILTFSRMREELRDGRDLKDSINNGFERSWPSVRDGNLTTLIVALILFFIGTSFVKGFALTLIIGLLVSLFSTMVVTRSFLRSFVETWFEKKKSFWI
jgi:preprotein translocase subunit SecD